MQAVRLVAAAIAVLVSLALYSCSEESLDPELALGPEPTRIEVDPASVEISVGDTVRLNGSVMDAAGNHVGDVDEWRSADSTIATVDADGLVKGVSGGQTNVEAIFEKVRAVVPTTVNDTALLVIPTQLTTVSSLKFGLSVYQDRIAWADFRSGQADIYMYDLSTGMETQLTSDTAWQGYPDIWGDTIVWASRTGTGATSIWMHDLETGEQKALYAKAILGQTLPSIHENRVAWEALDTLGQWDVYYASNGGAPVRATSDGFDQMVPFVWDDWITWSDNSRGDFDVVLYNIGTGATTRLTDEAGDQIVNDIRGDLIVWQDKFLDIWVYDISTGERTRITDSLGNRLAAIDGDWTVWEGSGNDVSLMYLPTLEMIAVDELGLLFHSEPDIHGRRVVFLGSTGGGEDHVYTFVVPDLQ